MDEKLTELQKGCLVYGVLLVIWLQLTTILAADCPIKECLCHDRDWPTDERIIDCRDKNLLSVPLIIASEEIFKELTFSSENKRCRDNIPSTCSNRIIHIANNTFAGLKVRKLDFSTNYVVSVSSDAFRGLETYLTELILEGNDLRSVPFASLPQLTNLKSLTIEHYSLIKNCISSFPQKFPHLETFVLDTLQMQYITSRSVVGKFPKLKRLEILGNPDFTRFPLGAIRFLTTLEQIRFVKNGISTFQHAGNALKSLHKLTQLDLSENKLNVLQFGCFNHIQQRIKYLGLHSNKLDGNRLITLTEGTWPKLETLVLDNNPLGTSGIPTNLFKNMPNLEYLYLVKTQLIQIEHNDFIGLSNLYFLDLSGNKITHIDSGTFTHTPNLKDLELCSLTRSNYKLNFTAETAQGLQHLQSINLQKIQLWPSSFWNSLSLMTGLKDIKLVDNGLSNIQDSAFQYNTQLERLEISSNSLTELTQAQINGLGGSLKLLDLSSNSITLIDKCVIEELAVLDTLKLKNNPLHCDCKLKALKEWTKLKQASIEYFEFSLNAECSTPKRLRNKSLTRLSKKHLVCPKYTQQIQCHNFTTPSSVVKPRFRNV
ncbi:protein artichoke-like [Mytilus californianus]|uniref:protein artichoke-like n=1 Tax=Mytilus californianus TaxID=6549 RepID=UPI0022454E23|nr:protein artichoke-like [Mytilus californianus]